MNGLHVHIGAAEFFQIAPFIVIFGFGWRTIAALFVNSDNPKLQAIGKAMAFIY